jgi:hypothetical protein
MNACGKLFLRSKTNCKALVLFWTSWIRLYTGECDSLETSELSFRVCQNDIIYLQLRQCQTDVQEDSELKTCVNHILRNIRNSCRASIRISGTFVLSVLVDYTIFLWALGVREVSNSEGASTRSILGGGTYFRGDGASAARNYIGILWSSLPVTITEPRTSQYSTIFTRLYGGSELSIFNTQSVHIV